MNTSSRVAPERVPARFFRCIAAVVLMLSIALPAAAADAVREGPSDTPALAMLAAKGLIGGKLTDDRGTAVIPSPPPGTEVTVYGAGRVDGPMDASISTWEEPLGDEILSVMVAKRGGATQVSYWVLPRRSLGCLVYSYRIFGSAGHVVRSEFWRRSDQIKTAEGKDFPSGLYPFGPNGGMPPTEVMRAIGRPAPGASATLYSQFTPDGYVILDLWAAGREEIEVPAGKIDAVRIIMRPNVRSFIPSWPGFILKVINPFLPKETFYFEDKPPYRFVKFEGVPGASGPRIRTELVRYYMEAPPQKALSSAR